MFGNWGALGASLDRELPSQGRTRGGWPAADGKNAGVGYIGSSVQTTRSADIGGRARLDLSTSQSVLASRGISLSNLARAAKNDSSSITDRLFVAHTGLPCIGLPYSVYRDYS